ncbi:hypothetical protein QBC34DRAFT_456007 [Podospora aff. communis PSN243]|uniref:Uncharacterized protein n=1 Tax=Podospora aff. communis PSN243 TaxID=3040156 RepID=A0AAV9FWA9_9PEZI|nr:hypothetical protein QBC34DRAFT_456007 [Podospora aff. communis PSN243]
MFSLSDVGRALALVSALTSIVSATPVPEPQRIVIPPAQNAWQARHGLTNANYQNTFNQLVGQGYRLNWVSGYTINNDPRFAAIWEQTNDGIEWVARHGLDSAQYSAAFNQYANQGYRLTLVNGYTVNNQSRFAAIWDKSRLDGAWVARHGMNNAQYQAAFDQYVGQGYKLVHVSGYSENNQPRFAAVFHRLNRPTGEAWVARHGLTKDAYWREFNNLLNQGYRLLTVSPYVVNGVEYFAAIWDQSRIPYWGAHHDLTGSQYQDAFNQYTAINAKLVAVAPYTLRGNQDRYAAIFTRNY